MATHPGAGRELIDELIATRRHAQRLFISLRFQGRDKEADQAEARVSELTGRIDALLADQMASWEKNAKQLTERLHQINRMLEHDVARVRSRASEAKTIASALGNLEEAVSLLSFWKR